MRLLIFPLIVSIILVGYSGGNFISNHLESESEIMTMVKLAKSEQAYNEGRIDLDKHMNDMAEFMKRDCLDTWEMDEMPAVCLRYIGESP